MKLKPATEPTAFRFHANCTPGSEPLFSIHKNGDVMRDGARINDDDHAMAEALRDWAMAVKEYHYGMEPNL